jgi:hypothetical protein
LAKQTKYKYSFITLEGQTCNVKLLFEGYTGSEITLQGADRPFVLKEYNTDDNIFKPLRPQMAEMNIIASSSSISIDDFLANNDTDIEVRFDFGSYSNYWVGYLLQDDFQEVWQDTNHIITLTATEYLGRLKEIEISNNGSQLIGKFTPASIVSYALNNSPVSQIGTRTINNLYHSSMTDSVGTTGFNQCYIDAKTFQINASQYDDAYNAIEKINKSWNQTLFQYRGAWVNLRVEELFIPKTENLRGYQTSLILPGYIPIDRRYDILIGKNESVKQITPEMIRFIRRKTKKDTIQFNLNQFDEIICNGSFSRGDLIVSDPSYKVYELNEWDWIEGSLATPTTPTTGSYGRYETFDVDFRLTDQYAYLTQDSSNTRFLRSCTVDVLQNEKLNFSIDHKYDINFGGNSTQAVFYVVLFGTSNNYFLDDDGVWYLSNPSLSLNQKSILIYYNGTGGLIPGEYNTSSVTSNSIPESGYIRIYLALPNTNFITNQYKRFKNLNIQISTTFNGINLETINAIQSIFTKTVDVKNNFEDEVYIDDGVSKLYKGSIFESDGNTLTNPTWYRYRYDTEEFGFRKQNAISVWENNRFNRNKIDGNFYGLTFNGGEPIGLINTIQFVDDDPNKVYYIANLKEIDFSSSTWSATLVEIFDEEKDLSSIGYEEDTYSAAATNAGGFPSGVVPYTVSNASIAFNIALGYKITYIETLSQNIDIVADIIAFVTIPSTPQTIIFSLKKNGVSIKSVSSTLTSLTTTLNIDLSINAISVAENDYFTVEWSSPGTITDVDIDGGTFNTTVLIPDGTGITYDSYEDKYIYK